MKTDIIHVSKSELRKSPGGVDCDYIKIGTTGIKAYSDAETRDRAVSNQWRLGDYAPKVIATDITVMVGNETYFGFETENIPHTIEVDRAALDNDDYKGWANVKIDYMHAAEKLAQLLQDELGVEWFDNHTGNIGFRENGEAVIIDCADRLFPNDRVGCESGSRI